MNLLLDTCTFLWIVADAPELTPRVRTLFQDPANAVYLSSVSAWEITVKQGLGRLVLPDLPERFIPEMRTRHAVAPLALEEDAVVQLAKLPEIHRDPFDRMLVCQALTHGLVLMTPDPQIRRYPVRTAW